MREKVLEVVQGFPEDHLLCAYLMRDHSALRSRRHLVNYLGNFISVSQHLRTDIFPAGKNPTSLIVENLRHNRSSGRAELHRYQQRRVLDAERERKRDEGRGRKRDGVRVEGKAKST